MKQNVTNLSQKVAQKYHCVLCDYNTSKLGDYKKHLLTIKHKKSENVTECNTLSQKVAKNMVCLCGNIYNNRSTLWRHKKICHMKSSDVSFNMNDKELIVMLIKENSQLAHHNAELADILKKNNNNSVHNSNNINNSMNNNKTFNLQFFLNETCKDAMDINEFVNNMKIELDDLENTGRTSYVEGISNIVIKNLNKLEQPLRPLHCGDFKREVLYIKHNNEWTKETDDKPILTKAIKTIANENIKQISKWKDKYPDCVKSDSKKNDLYLKIVSNSMNGLTKEEGDKNISKIISNVAKKVIIDKNTV